MEKYELYIDFDGVILDTIPQYNKKMQEMGIDLKDKEAIEKFFPTFDFSKVIDDKFILNDSINCIQKLIDSGKFHVSLLSHVSSIDEGVLKVNYIRKYFDDITVILVPKKISKTKMIHTRGAILVDDYSKNLIEWESEGGIGVRFNLDYESKGFRVISKLDQLLEMFK